MCDNRCTCKPTDWKQQQGELVREYAQFIADNHHRMNISPKKKWDKFFGRFRPSSAVEWFYQGMLPEISQLLPDNIYENYDLTCSEKMDITQDAEFLMTLNKKKTLYAPPGVPVSNRNGFWVDADGYVTVYTDGACPSNGRNGATAGIGVFFGNDHHLNLSEPLSRQDPATNQVAEIRAAIKAIEVAKENGVESLVILTDSKYLMDSINNWIFKWLANGWRNCRGEILGHRKLFRELLFAMEGIDVKWCHVRSHYQDPCIAHRHGNTEADLLAREGAKRY